jgi:hypothetical protein
MLSEIRCIWWVIKGHHVVAPHSIDDFRSVVASRVVHVHSQRNR